jgi:hypothetical protein
VKNRKLSTVVSTLTWVLSKFVLIGVLTGVGSCGAIAVDGDIGATGKVEEQLVVVGSERTPERPVGTFFSTTGTRFLAWIGTDHHISLMQGTANDGWGSKQTLTNETVLTSAGISLAEFNGRLFLAWTGLDHRLNVRSSADGTTWLDSDKLILPSTSDRGPALASHGGKLYLAYTGPVGYLYMSSFDGTPGTSFSPYQVLSTSIATENGPSLTSFSGQLLVGWTGKDNQLNIGELSSNHLSVGRTVTIPEETDRGVSILGFGSELLVAWKGTDLGHHLNLAAIDECSVDRMLRGAPAPLSKTTLADFSDRGPNLVNYNGSAAMLWKGQNDQEVVVSEHIREITPDADPSSSLACSSTGKGHAVPATVDDAATEANSRIYRLVSTWLRTFNASAAPLDAFGPWEEGATTGFRRIAAGLLAQELTETAGAQDPNPDLAVLRSLTPEITFSQNVEEWMLHSYQHRRLGSAGEFDFHLAEAMNVLSAFGNLRHPDGSHYLTDETVMRMLTYRGPRVYTDANQATAEVAICQPGDSAATCRQNFTTCPAKPARGGLCEPLNQLTGNTLSNLSHKEVVINAITLTVPETENHVPMINGAKYLMNQWIRTNPRQDPTLKAIFDANPAAFVNEGSTLEQGLLSIISRVMKNGYFEENARPYQGYTLKMLMTLSTFAESEKVRTAARNAVDFTGAMVAFQSSYGKRYAPMRRRWNRRDEVTLYGGDYVPPMFGILTGSYAFDDDPIACASSCPAPNSGERCDKDNCAWFTEGDQYRGFALDAWISGYRVPRMIHDFMLRPDNGQAGFGAYTQISTRYSYWMYGAHEPARYPAPNVMGDPDLDAMARTAMSGLHAYRDTREQYFSTRDFLNSSGGHYDHWPFEDHLDDTEAFLTPDDLLHDVDFLPKATTLLLPGLNRWANKADLDGATPHMSGAAQGTAMDFLAPNGPVYKNVALGQSDVGLAPASIPPGWSQLAADVLYPGTHVKVFAAPSGNLRVVVLSLDQAPHVGLWEVIPSELALAPNALLTLIKTRNAGLQVTANSFQYRTIMSDELLDVSMSDYLTGKLLVLNKIDGQTAGINSPSQAEIISTPLALVRQTNASYGFSGVEYLRAMGDGLVTIKNPQVSSNPLILDSRDPQNPTRYLALTRPSGLTLSPDWLPPVKGTFQTPKPGFFSITPDAAGLAQIETQLMRTGSDWAPGSFSLQLTVGGTPSPTGRLKFTLASSVTGVVQLGATVLLADIKAAGSTKLIFNVPSDALSALKASTVPVTLTLSLSNATGASVEIGSLLSSSARTVTDGQALVGQWDQLWSTTASTSMSTTATVGTTAQKVCGTGFRTLESPTFNPRTFSWISRRLAVDVRIPTNMPNPYWLGAVQVTYLNRSKAVTQFLGQVELTGLGLGEWTTVSFTLPDSVYQALQVDAGGTSIQVAINADLAGGGECFLFDNVRFLGPSVLNVAAAPAVPTPTLSLAGSVFGFESISAWHANNGAPEPTLVNAPVTGGVHALRVPVSGWTLIESALFSTAELQTHGGTLQFDVIPPAPVNPYWPGDVSVFLECPSANLWNQWVGIAALPAGDGQAHAISLPLPAALAQALNGSNDCLLRIAVNAPMGAGGFVLDTLRLAP